MGLINTIKNWFRIRSKEAEAALINPVEKGVLAIEDAKKQTGQFEQAIAGAMAQNNILKRRKADAEDDSKKFAKIADLAVDKGNDSDAREALAKKATFDKVVKNLAAEIATNETLISNQRNLLERAKGKIETAETSQEILAARLQGAQARQDMAKAESQFANGEGLAAIADLEKAVDAVEAKAEALEELSGSGKETLEEKYDNTDADVEAALNELKAKKGAK